MNKTSWGLSLSFLILALSLAGGLAQADPPGRSAHGASDSPGSYSAAALYNRGNTYARAGKPALAVLNYERARLLAPQNPDILANLQHVRAAASLPPATDALESHLRLMSPNATYWFGLAGLVMAGTFGLLLALKKGPRMVSGAAMGGGLLMLAYCLSDAVVTEHFMREAVVMQSASASAAPIASAEALFTLPPGSLVKIQEEHGNFVLVGDARKNVGWVLRKQLASVINPDQGTPG